MKDTIKTGLLSFGMSGQLFHAPFVNAHDGFELTAVVERSKKQAHTSYPYIKSHDSVEAILDDESIELVIVNTPNTTHFDFTQKALEKGKHVLTEKPFTITPDQAKQLFGLAKKEGRNALPYQNRRFDSDFLSVKKVLDSGKLGKLVEVHFRFDRYDLAIGPKAGMESPVPGSGLFYDLGPHVLDQIISIFGIPLHWTKSLGHFRPGTQVDDYAHIHLTYPDALQVFVTTSLLVADTKPAFVLNGTKGSFVKRRADIQEDQLLAAMSPKDDSYGVEGNDQEGVLMTIAEDGSKKSEMIRSAKSNYLNMFDAVYETIRNGKPYPITQKQVLAQLEILNG